MVGKLAVQNEFLKKVSDSLGLPYTSTKKLIAKFRNAPPGSWRRLASLPSAGPSANGRMMATIGFVIS